MAKDYAERARWVLREAEEALEATNYAICVRRSQEALELSAKAALRRVAIEYPHEHDVSEALEAAADRMPDNVRRQLEEIKALSAELARIRGPALYGYEAEGVPASEAFTRDYAARTLDRVKSIVNLLVAFAGSP
jgi:HEPN domain-containing protein